MTTENHLTKRNEYVQYVQINDSACSLVLHVLFS